MRELIIFLYFFLLAYIAIYGVHIYWLVWLHFSHRKKIKRIVGFRDWFPTVTIQLPIYNEKRVAARLLRAAASMDWPPDKLVIQVLDDSSDETTSLIASEIATLEPRGLTINHLTRSERTGYKAGALAFGLEQDDSEFVAIFDADNVPEPGFLKAMIPHLADPAIGMAQAHWSFLNREESILCRAQALFLDAHFHVEQAARSSGGLFMNFNGTAGVWRRRAIDDAGGWQADTLTEDLDLSYRAQMKGWKLKYVDDVDVPSELPGSIRGFKTQQYRWTRGATETAIKILPKLLASDLPARVKISAFFHLTQKSISLALLLLSVLLIPALYFRLETGLTKILVIDLPIFLAGTGSMTILYGVALRRSRDKSSRTDRLLAPVLTSLGIGLAINNSMAILGGLRGRHAPFIRTPKSGTETTQKLKVPVDYRIPTDPTMLLESGFALYALTAVAVAVSLELYFAVPFLMTFTFGYFYFTFLSWRERYA